MEDTRLIIATLEHLVEHLLDYEAQLQKTRDPSLAVPLASKEDLLGSSSTTINVEQLQAEITHLNRLIADRKMVLLEFIPHYFQAIPVQVHGQVYFISKFKRRDNQPALFIVRRKDKA